MVAASERQRLSKLDAMNCLLKAMEERPLELPATTAEAPAEEERAEKPSDVISVATAAAAVPAALGAEAKVGA